MEMIYIQIQIKHKLIIPTLIIKLCKCEKLWEFEWNL